MVRLTLSMLAAVVCGSIVLGLRDGQPAATQPSKDAAKPPAAVAGQEFPDAIYFYGNKRPAKLRAMEGKAAPELRVTGWIGEAQKLANLKGKVVVVDFWGTWCPPCRAALPHNVSMVNKYGDKGLVIIGVHDSSRGADKMAAMAKDKGLNYPLSVDDRGASTKAFGISFWPTYFVIDRKGIVRAAGLLPDEVDQVVVKLLNENSEPATQPAASQPAAN